MVQNDSTAVLSALVPTGPRVVAVAVAFLLPLLAAGCTNSSDTADLSAPAGPRMCGFMSKAQLAKTVGRTKDLSPADDTVHDGCSWRAIDSDGIRPSNSGMVLWDTEQSALDTGPEGLDTATIDGHPALIGQSERITLVYVSTSDDLEAPGNVFVSFRRGGPDARNTAITLAKAALAYVTAHD